MLEKVSLTEEDKYYDEITLNEFDPDNGKLSFTDVLLNIIAQLNIDTPIILYDKTHKCYKTANAYNIPDGDNMHFVFDIKPQDDKELSENFIMPVYIGKKKSNGEIEHEKQICTLSYNKDNGWDFM